ncbi:MAG: hypothetical protein HQL98_15515 [Magnetococcales bacterium]|nr:hypothetical protein [Magnetococcales bacterium]
MKQKVEEVRPYSDREREILRRGDIIMRNGLYGPIEIQRAGAIRRMVRGWLHWIKRRVS